MVLSVCFRSYIEKEQQRRVDLGIDAALTSLDVTDNTELANKGVSTSWT